MMSLLSSRPSKDFPYHSVQRTKCFQRPRRPSTTGSGSKHPVLPIPAPLPHSALVPPTSLLLPARPSTAPPCSAGALLSASSALFPVFTRLTSLKSLLNVTLSTKSIRTPIKRVPPLHFLSPCSIFFRISDDLPIYQMNCISVMFLCMVCPYQIINLSTIGISVFCLLLSLCIS